MPPKSNSLFHFTKSVDFLKGILQGGFHPRYCLEDTGYLDIDYIGYPMVCFCDIPLSRIADHTGFYGSYGLGMTKEWAIKNSLAPLLYAVNGGLLTEFSNYLLRLNMTNASGDTTPEQHNLNGFFFRLVAMTKPVAGKMVVAGAVVEKEFHQENEWRFVPREFTSLFKDKFDAEREAMNLAVAKYKLDFSPSDVKYIFVKLDAEIPAMVDFVQTALGHFPHNDIKILVTRIVSLETIGRDV